MDRKDVDVQRLIRQLSAVRDEMLALESDVLHKDLTIHPEFRESAQNLVHYVALRRHDIRGMQADLAALGLSSLGRSESRVLDNVEAVLENLYRIPGTERVGAPAEYATVSERGGRELLRRHTADLLGGRPADRHVRILVTLGGEVAGDGALVRGMIDAGMDCARINCAHDDPATWTRLVETVRTAAADAGRECRILMDLAGPKLRTGPVSRGPEVLKLRPGRDALGGVEVPARVRLYPAGGIAELSAIEPAAIGVDASWLERLAPADTIEFLDTRGKRRCLKIDVVDDHGAIATADATAYFTNGVVLEHVPTRLRCSASGIRPVERRLTLSIGDALVLTHDDLPGEDAVRDANGVLLRAAHIGCTLPEVFPCVRAGERVWFDDGRIGGVVRYATPDQVCVEITDAAAGGARLGADKGINLPDSALELPALTDKDREDLNLIVGHADLVGLSFVHEVADVDALEDELAARGAADMGIVLKIETQRAFENLPNLLIASMRRPCRGLMIARGDLAVECGFERLAEVQEEMLWLCEAAHLPVIWATQVLENLAKTGQPSRAEITDAAMSNRAECVMLNKGPHILEAVRVLDNIIRRMEAHQDKKRPVLRPLHVTQSMSRGA